MDKLQEVIWKLEKLDSCDLVSEIIEDLTDDGLIKACNDELVIESVIKTVTHVEAFTLEFISQEYKLQTFFGNDIHIEVDANDLIIGFVLCDIRDNDWEEGEEHIPKRIMETNRRIARLYGNQTPVRVLTDNNWKREETKNIIKEKSK